MENIALDKAVRQGFVRLGLVYSWEDFYDFFIVRTYLVAPFDDNSTEVFRLKTI